jgi:Flp pilus assembly protein TadD
MDASTNVIDIAAMPAPAAARIGLLGRLRRRMGSYDPSEREIALGLVLAVVVVFAHALYNEFVQWDDPINLVNNPSFRGLGWAQIRWMFTTTLMGHYIPVTWLTFGLDYVLWGMEPSGYHLTNLVLHTINVVLFYYLALRLLVRALPWATTLEIRAGAALAALFFGIHPLRAESVAWATERRDVLSGLMFLASVSCYVASTQWEGWKRRRRLTAALLFFVLSLLSKSITMTLPAALLILDFYPLRRLGHSPREWFGRAGRRVLLEKVPFLAVALIGAYVSYWAVAHHDFFTSTQQYPLLSRLALALYSICFYIGKTALPLGLSPLYELPAKVDILDSQFAFAGIAAGLMTVALLALWRKWPAGSCAYVYYVVVITPVGGLVHAGFQLAHDRYSYLSCLGFALLAGGIPALLGRARARAKLEPRLLRLVTAAIVAWVVVFGALTWDQVRVWRSTESLWVHAATTEPECAICQNNYGALLVNGGNSRAGILALANSLAVRPDREKAYGGIGLALIQLGRVVDAEPYLRRALAMDQYDVGLLNNLSISLIRQGKFAEAIPYLRRALVLDPVNMRARANLGASLAGIGQVDAGLREFHRAAAQDAYAEEPRIGLVNAYLQKGDVVEARKHYTILRQQHPQAAAPLAHRFKS